MKIVGTINGGIVGSGSFRVNDGVPNTMRMTDSAIATGNVNLASELEKKDILIREPLTSFTYHRDIPIKTGGGWVDVISSLSSDFAAPGGSGDSLITSGGSNSPKVIQANFEKETFRAHAFQILLRILYMDMQKSKVTGRSLESLLKDGIRLTYDKHLDQNVYIGMPTIGTPGILNNPDIVAIGASVGAGGETVFTSKTPNEILSDINQMLSDTWEQAEYDLSALPNHIIMPYAQYNYLATTRLSDLSDKTILDFILESNISSKNGGKLVIGATAYCKGIGVGGSDRMACYVHHDRFMAMEELVPLHKAMTQPNINSLSYDSFYTANISQVEFFYNQTVRYLDGI